MEEVLRKERRRSIHVKPSIYVILCVDVEVSDNYRRPLSDLIVKSLKRLTLGIVLYTKYIVVCVQVSLCHVCK